MKKEPAQLNKQHKKILTILLACGEKGMNSWRHRGGRIQLPARIFELKKKGFQIVSVENKNTSVNYVLLAVPKPFRDEVEALRPRMSTRFMSIFDVFGSLKIR